MENICRLVLKLWKQQQSGIILKRNSLERQDKNNQVKKVKKPLSSVYTNRNSSWVRAVLKNVIDFWKGLKCVRVKASALHTSTKIFGEHSLGHNEATSGIVV